MDLEKEAMAKKLRKEVSMHDLHLRIRNTEHDYIVERYGANGLALFMALLKLKRDEFVHSTHRAIADEAMLEDRTFLKLIRRFMEDGIVEKIEGGYLLLNFTGEEL